MYFDPKIILYGAIFVATLLLVEGIFYLLRDLHDGPERALNRRMRMIASGTDTRTTLRKLRRDTRDPVSRFLAGLAPATDRLILHAGMTMSLTRLLGIMALIWTITFSLLEILTASPIWVTTLVATIIGVGVPYFYLKRKKATRLKSFGEQLPDALDLIVRGLRAGHPVSSAISLVSKEMTDPVGSEFGIVVDEMTYGLDLSEALNNLSERVPHDDLQFLVVTIQIQYMVGGNLAEVLNNLSKVIRDRHQMFAKIRAVTAEGRMSAVVIGVSPIIFAILVMLTSPHFFLEVIDDPLFWPLMACAFASMVMGQYVLHKMVNFEV